MFWLKHCQFRYCANFVWFHCLKLFCMIFFWHLQFLRFELFSTWAASSTLPLHLLQLWSKIQFVLSSNIFSVLALFIYLFLISVCSYWSSYSFASPISMFHTSFLWFCWSGRCTSCFCSAKEFNASVLFFITWSKHSSLAYSIHSYE